MVYECDQCSAALPAGAVVCPRCGEGFEEAVPADALVPQAGFTASEREVARQEQVERLEADVLTLKGQVATVIQYAAALEGKIEMLTNRMTVVEMAGRENKRRFAEHVEDVQAALLSAQLFSLSDAAGSGNAAGRTDASGSEVKRRRSPRSEGGSTR